jgi:von Willebrand factor type A domain
MRRCRGAGPKALTSLIAGMAILSTALCVSRVQAQSETTKPAGGDTGPGPKVISKAKEKEKERSSPFLRPPGTNRYDPDSADWREVPPWRQASFFGIRARGQFFVYVVDCSGSMIEEDRLGRAKDEVRRSVLRLRDPQRFKVIFYNDEPIAMPGDLPRTADLTAKSQLLYWLRLIEPDGATDPRGALGLALAMRPDAVFLLSDGEYPEGTVAAIARKNARKIPIHCVDLSGGAAGDQLQRIARDSGGQYAARPWQGD